MLSDFMGEITPELREIFQVVIPLGRLGQLYLAGDEADFITSVALEVDSGSCV